MVGTSFLVGPFFSEWCFVCDCQRCSDVNDPMSEIICTQCHQGPLEYPNGDKKLHLPPISIKSLTSSRSKGGLFAVENNCCDFLDLAEAQKLYPETSFNHRSAAFCHRQVEISVIVPQ